MKTATKELEIPIIEITPFEGEYRFLDADDEHRHQIYEGGEWKDLIGISSVTKDITDFSIASYYGARRTLMALGYDPKLRVGDFNKILNDLKQQTEEGLKTLFNKAYKAASAYTKERQELGTDAHKVVEEWVKECMALNNGLPIPSENPIIKKFMNLVAEWNPRFIASEKKGHNKDLWIGGISDLIVETSQGLGIWDMKNRPAIYDKDLIQMGGYACLFPMEFTHVLGVPLEGKETRAFYDVEKLRDVFISQLNVYKFRQSVKPKYD